MTSSEIVTVESQGVSCRSDFGLYRADGYENTISVLSIYGASQQTRALFSAVATNRTVYVGGTPLERPREAIRFKGTKIGYAKHHGIITSEQVGKEIIVWTTEGERLNQLHLALSGRRVPFEPERLPQIEKVLLNSGYLVRLSGWGTIGGYFAQFNDDEICNLILTDVYRTRAGTRNAA